MDVPSTLRASREREGLSQAALAERTGTSQATISAYESGRKQPSLDTLSRLLAATGQRLAVEPARRYEPTRDQHGRVGRILAQVLALSDALALAAPTPVLRRRAPIAERLVELDRSLTRRRIPHAFGGAIALAYWTLDPRGTRDIDVNVFVPASEAGRVLRAIPEGVEQPDETAAVIARDGRIRLWWSDTPVDLYFESMPIDRAAARNRRMVPFEKARIPVLGPIEVAVYKAIFDRTRDWADIEAMTAAGTLDVAAVRATLATLVAEDDLRLERLASLAS